MHIALVQIGDIDVDASAGRVHVGMGDLPLKRIIGDVLDAGYEGVFDLEVVPADFSAETDEHDLRRGIEAASALMKWAPRPATPSCSLEWRLNPINLIQRL